MKQIVQKRDDVAFYLVMYPLTQIHPDSYEKSKAIACEKDGQKALQMLEDVYAKKPIPKASCETDAVDKIIAVAEQLGITGTPAMIFENGRKVPGALTADNIIKIIDGIKKK